MSLSNYYQAAVVKGDITSDVRQERVVEHLQQVADELIQRKHWWQRSKIQGLYLYGPVGAGKTFLMNLFYDYVPEQKKKRIHFHHFMQEVDAQLRQLQGKKDPLRVIAKRFSKTTRLLCLDEFLVHDVADAMILSELLQSLFREGIVMVATANTPPDLLYLHGVQRDRFLPAIAAIQAHCSVLELDEDRDYRRGRHREVITYFSPITSTTIAAMTAAFDAIAAPSDGVTQLMIQNRWVPVVKSAARAVWFEFGVICHIPRCQLDYLEIAERFDTVFISHIPKMTENDTVGCLLFIHLIDVLYDCHVKLIVSAEVPVSELYTQGPLRHAFQRTLSRLEEMQSVDYLGKSSPYSYHI